jgi:hypothetical protein
MTRILADLPSQPFQRRFASPEPWAASPIEDIKWLDQRAAEQGKSRAFVLSMIVRWYRHHIENDK